MFDLSYRETIFSNLLFLSFHYSKSNPYDTNLHANMQGNIHTWTTFQANQTLLKGNCTIGVGVNCNSPYFDKDYSRRLFDTFRPFKGHWSISKETFLWFWIWTGFSKTANDENLRKSPIQINDFVQISFTFTTTIQQDACCHYLAPKKLRWWKHDDKEYKFVWGDMCFW